MENLGRNLWRFKIWRLPFFSLPPGISTPLPPPQLIDPAPNWKDLGHYMKSFIKFIYIKIRNHRFDARNNISLSVIKYVQKCPRNLIANKKNSSFELKMG